VLSISRAQKTMNERNGEDEERSLSVCFWRAFCEIKRRFMFERDFWVFRM
jgi:hypothetical protein